jgi:HK97 family phage major capsid protein
MGILWVCIPSLIPLTLARRRRHLIRLGDGKFLGIVDTLGRPLFVPSVNTDSLESILGRPVVISQYHPNLASTVVGVVQFGSLTDGYVLRTAGDVSILRLNERYADTGEVGFIGYHRNSGFATDAEPIRFSI